MAPRARSYDRLRRRDLDSEGDDERACFEPESLSRLTGGCRVAWRKRDLKPRDKHRLLRRPSRDSTAHVLSDQSGRALCDVWAAVVRGEGRCAGRVRMLAQGTRESLGVAPDRAQQRGARPHRQDQHDRKDSCSEHVDAHSPESKARTTPEQVRRAKMPNDFARVNCPNPAGCGISPTRCREPRTPCCETDEYAGQL